MKRILAIDGGGIKGMFPASFLATVEDTIGDRIANYFDLIVGTSTGGIIALGLGLGLSADEIMNFYQELGPKVFYRNNLFRKMMHFVAGKYDSGPLREVLETTFGANKLGDSTKRLVIPSLNLEIGEPYIYKTAHNSRFARDYKELAVDVALATSAGPTYFPTHWSTAGTPLIDGGVYVNNPTGMTVVEAIGVLGWQKDEINVLSLGCTSSPLTVSRARKFNLGALLWARPIVDVFMAAQSHASMGTAAILLGGHDRIIRIDPVVQSNRFGMDTVDEIRSLRGLGASEARHALPRLREKFFIETAELFEPYHKLNNNGTSSLP